MDSKFEGIVLFQRPHRENDALVKLFTQEYGTKMFFVKGLQKPSHPLKANLIPLTRQSFVGRVNQQGLSFIREANCLDFYPAIQKDPVLLAHASYISQLIDASTDDNVKDVSLYQFFYKSLTFLNEGYSADAVHLVCDLRLLKRFGVQLDWQHCRVCGNQVGPFDFSMRYQGLLCQTHWSMDSYRLRLKAESIPLIQSLSGMSLSRFRKLEIEPELARDLRRLLFEIYNELVGIHLKTQSYIQEMDQMQTMMKEIPKRNK